MSLQTCAEIVRRGDPDRFLSVMAAPPEAREKLFPIYAFNVEVARAPWVTQEPMIAEMRLQWWQDALTEIAEGATVRRHEVVDELVGRLPDQAIAHLSRLIEARRWDAHKEAFDGRAAFDAYLRDTSGGLIAAAALMLGGRVDDTLLDFGQVVGMANWFRAVPHLKASGRSPLVDESPAAIAAMATDGLTLLNATSRKLDGKARPAARAGWLARSILKKAAHSPQAVLDGGLEPSSFRQKTLLLSSTFTGRI